jgi:hypothetical protein
MDLADVGPQLQAMVIRAALEHINGHETGVLTVFPEAWEFAPRAGNTPAKDQAIAMARKGAVLRNFLLCDSQDISGVDTVLRQAASVWIIGVQREANELKRTLAVVKSSGVKVPKPAEVATLQIGQFFVCFGSTAIKTYVRPPWLSEQGARGHAIGGGPVPPLPPASATPRKPRDPTGVERETLYDNPLPATAPTRVWKDIAEVRAAEARYLQESEEPELSANVEKKLDALLDYFKQLVTASPPPLPPPRTTPVSSSQSEQTTHVSSAPIDEEQLYQRIKARLTAEAPALIKLLVETPEISVKVERTTIEADGKSLFGRIALLVRNGFLDQPVTNSVIAKELGRIGAQTHPARTKEALAKLQQLGFVTSEGDGYQAVNAAKKRITEAG